MNKIIPLKFESYIASIKNSLGSRQFRQFYAKVDGKKKEILRSGELSCAFFVSFILHAFSAIKEVHTTVDGTISDLKKSGWKKANKPKLGDVLVWENIIYPDGEGHKHIGFYVSGNKAVSNSSKKKIPVVHHWTFNGKRKVQAIYHKKI